jgi:hypothetical protein
MASGYEDQITPADMDFAIEDPNERLRQAFAQILAQNGQGGAAPMDALMAAQMQQQMPMQPGVQKWDLPMGQPGDFAAMPQQSMNPRGMNFPTAPMGAESPLQSNQPPPQMPKVPDEPPRAPAPFNGKGEVVGAYELPKKKSKKGKD